MGASKKMIDSHCHIIDTPATLTLLQQVETSKLIVMGTKLADWTKVSAIYYIYPSRIIPSFGIHPWFATSDSHLDIALITQKLEENLRNMPDAIVGEIGMDGVAKDSRGIIHDIALQFRIFQIQMQIAAKMSRPVSVHCVQWHGKMFDYFRSLNSEPLSSCPPSIMMHSFSGSVEIMQALCRLVNIGTRFYFSFSMLVNSRSMKFAKLIAEAPEDKILLESDCHDVTNVDDHMLAVLKAVSHIRLQTFEYLQQKITLNTTEFLGIGFT